MLAYPINYERYFAYKESYLRVYKGLAEFRAALHKHYGYLPYAKDKTP